MIILAGFMTITVVGVAYVWAYDTLAERFGWEQ